MFHEGAEKLRVVMQLSILGYRTLQQTDSGGQSRQRHAAGDCWDAASGRVTGFPDAQAVRRFGKPLRVLLKPADDDPNYS